MSIESQMKSDIGRKIKWCNDEIIITNAFSCYDGDFYEYKILPVNDKSITYRINIWSDEGIDFIKVLT